MWLHLWSSHLFVMNQVSSFHWTDIEKMTFSSTQIEICEMKESRKTNVEILAHFSLHSVANIYTSVKSTMCGNIWKPGEDVGGRPSYLSDIDTILFENHISKSCFDLQCLNTKQAMQIIMDLKQQRYERAKFIANLCCQNASMTINYQKIINELCPFFPSPSWLTNFCQSKDIYLKSPNTLEDARKYYCNTTTISNFFNTHGHLLANKDPRLIFNADESSSMSSKKFKALTLNRKNICTVTVSAKEPHISGVFCYNAAGFKLKPMIILPGLKKLPSELTLFNAFFTSQKSGWMTNKLFISFCIYFVCCINEYRLTLPKNIQNDRIILLVDNHPSRCNSYAIEFLARHNIDLLTFPPHTTHVIQPFDVCVAGPLKTAMSSFKVSNLTKSIAQSFPNEAQRIRYLTISSILNSWYSISSELLRKSFEATGICPLNRLIPLNNRLTNRVVHPAPPGRRANFSIGCKLLTSPPMRIALYNKQNNAQIISINQIFCPTYKDFYDYLYQDDIAQGLNLQNFPPLLITTAPGKYEDAFYDYHK